MDAWVSPLVKWFNGEGASVAVVQEPTEDAELPATDIGANQSTEQKERAQTIRNPSPIDHLLQQSTALKHGLSQDTHEQHYTHPTKKMLSIKDVLADPSSEGLQSQRTFVDSDPSLLMKFSNEDFIPTSAPVPTSTSVASTLPIPTAVALDEDVIGSILNTQQPQQILRDNPALTADQIASTPTPDSQPTRPKISIRSIVHALEWMIHNNNNRKRNKNEEETVIDDNHSYDTKTSSQQETSKRRKQRKQPSHPASPPPPPRPMISRTRLKVFVGTWNMMGQIPHISEGLTGFLEVQDPVVQNQQQQNCPDEQHKPGNFPSSPLLSPLSTLSEPDSNPSSTGTTQFQETVERKQKQQKQQQKPQHFARGIPSSMSTPNLLLSQSSMMSDTNSTEAPRQEFKQRGLFNRFKYKNNHKSSSGSNNGTPRVNLKPSPSVSNLPSHFQYHQQQQQQQYHHYLKQGFSQQRTPSLNPLPQVPTILKDPFLEMNAKAPYHIIAINTQECEREIREAVLFPSKSVWEKYLQKSLGPDYVMIKTETMAALHLAVFIWKPIEDLVTAVDSSTVATGIGGIVGNKGAVAISVYLGSMSFLFVNAHLTAHQNNTQARNNDYKRIIQELQLNDAPKSSPGGWYFGGDMRLRRHYNSPPVATGPSLQKPAYYGNNSNNKNNNSNSNIKRNDNAGGGSNGEKKSTNQSSTHSDGSESKKSSNNKNEGDKDKDKDPRMPRKDGRESGDSNVTQNSSANVDITNQFDYTFWAGDLNYRVDMTRAEADECLQKGDLKTLLAHDQLTLQREAGAVFEGFMEAPITFKPTYKFDPLSQISSSSSEKSDNGSRLRRIRSRTLMGRPKSMMNLSISVRQNCDPSPTISAIGPATFYGLDVNKSCPTLPLHGNIGNVGLSSWGAPPSLDPSLISKPADVTHASDGSNDKEKRELAVSRDIQPIQRHQPVLFDSKLSQHQYQYQQLPNQSQLQKTQPDDILGHPMLDDQAPKIGDPVLHKELFITPNAANRDIPVKSEPTPVPVQKGQQYDTSSKQRVPSWTDRILWKSTGGNYYLPLEIGDNTRSGGIGAGGKRGWDMLKRNRSKIVSDREDEGNEHTYESVSGSSLTSDPGSILKSVVRKKSKDHGATTKTATTVDGKVGFLESLKTELHHVAGSRARRGRGQEREYEPIVEAAAATGAAMMSKEDEDRAAVIVKQYTAHHDVGLFSDHRPVTAVFAVRFDWNLTDRGGAGILGAGGIGGGHNTRLISSQWSPLDKVLEKMSK